MNDTRAAFTLVEMSLVLIVIGLIILIVFPALTAVRLNTQRNLTDSNLLALMRATAAYVQATGCVPCPTPAATTGAGHGYVRGVSGGAACSACATPEGIPPFASLGIPASLAHDGWGRWITMRVDPALTVNFGVVPPTGNTGLCSTGLSATNRISVQTPAGATQQAAVIFVSHGADGYGAWIASALATGLNGSRTPFPTSMPTCAATGYARCNGDGDATFSNTSFSASATNPFDDSLVFLGRNALVSLFGTTACTTVW